MKSRAAGSYLVPSAGRMSDRIAAFGGGRVCETPGCDTVLSKYNPAPYCSLHDPLSRHVRGLGSQTGR
jgi:hypothetical protein